MLVANPNERLQCGHFKNSKFIGQVTSASAVTRHSTNLRPQRAYHFYMTERLIALGEPAGHALPSLGDVFEHDLGRLELCQPFHEPRFRRFVPAHLGTQFDYTHLTHSTSTHPYNAGTARVSLAILKQVTQQKRNVPIIAPDVAPKERGRPVGGVVWLVSALGLESRTY